MIFPLEIAADLTVSPNRGASYDNVSNLNNVLPLPLLKMVGYLNSFVSCVRLYYHVACFWTAVINGVHAPPLLVLLMLIANNLRIMGEHVNGADSTCTDG